MPVAPTRRAWWAYSDYVVVILGAALLIVTAYLIVAAPGLFRVDLPGALLGIAAFLIGLAVLDRFPRQILVDPKTIQFEYLLSRISLRWDQLTAPTLMSRGFVSFRAVTGARGVWGSLTVTLDQARAILNYPECPRLELPPNLQHALEA
jgi:hypothetical protein